MTFIKMDNEELEQLNKKVKSLQEDLEEFKASVSKKIGSNPLSVSGFIGALTVDSAGHVKGGQTEYNTGAGFFLGKDGDYYKFSVGDPSSYYITFDGSTLIVNAIQTKVTTFVASANTKSTSDTELTEAGTSYTKKKEAFMGQSGTIRISFDLKATNVTYAASGRIYRNGVAVGTERTNSTTSYVTYTEDFTVYTGDFIQLYSKTADGGYPAYTRNFRIGFDRTVGNDVTQLLYPD